MYILILMIFLAMKAEAACELQVTVQDETVKVPLTLKRGNLIEPRYEARAGGFIAKVVFNRHGKWVVAKVTGPAGENFEFNTSGTDLIEELDCLGGSVGAAQFRFKCDSVEWREMKKRNGWETWCGRSAEQRSPLRSKRAYAGSVEKQRSKSWL